MKIIEELQRHGEVYNMESLANILKPITAHEGLSDEFFEEVRVFHYTVKSRSIREYSFKHTEDAVFKIVKFPKTRNFFNHPWAFGFLKVDTPDGVVWRGTYAGRHGELFAKMKKVARSETSKVLLTKVDFPRAITRADIYQKVDVAPFANSLYRDLFDKSEWDCLGGVKGLEGYLKNLTYVARSKALFQKKVPKEYLLAKEDSGYTLLFNSGLFDQYQNFVILRVDLRLYNTSLLSEPYYVVSKLSRVNNLSDYGLEDMLPVMQLCDKSLMMFQADKITLINNQGLDHIFRDRTDRLEFELKDYPSDILYSSLEYSINLALKRTKVDAQYLVPFLNMKWDKVSYLIPFYLRHSNNPDPICSIVIGEVSEGVWAPVTILKLETARSNARLLGRLNSSWLTNVKGGLKNEDCKASG